MTGIGCGVSTLILGVNTSVGGVSVGGMRAVRVVFSRIGVGGFGVGGLAGADTHKTSREIQVHFIDVCDG